jgi:hypothetical protein
VDFDLFGCNSYYWEPIVYNPACTWVYAYWSTYVSGTLLPYANFHGGPALYQNVDEYTDGITSGVNLKKSYTYAAENDFIISVPSSRYSNQYYMECPWRKGQLQNLTEYKYNTLTGYVPKRTQYYSYTDYRVNTVIAGTKLERLHPVVNPCSYENYNPGTTYQQYFTYFDVPIEVGIRNLTGVSTTEFDDNGNSIVTSESTSYGSPYHLFPTAKTSIASNGDTRLTAFTYPRDYAGTTVYDQMIARNIISPVIEQSDYKNSTANFLQSAKTDYSFWANGQPTTTVTGQIYPLTSSTKKGASSYDPRVQFLGYNANGNVQSISKVGGSKINFVYGYGGSYPIAQITNADYSTIETLLGGQTNVDNFRNTLNPTDAQVNTFLAPLRVISNLPNAQVSTFTYKPLAGMTSATDAKGLTTYYEYDDSQRLRFAKNKDHNILKAYCYNYKGQQTNCYTPGQSSTVYARIEITNQTYDSWQNGDDYYYNASYGDVYLRFYSDATCQTPLTLTSGMTVSMATTTNRAGISYNTTTSNTDYNVSPGVSSVYLGNLFMYYDLDDYSYNYSYDYYDYTYDTVPHTGSNYICVGYYIY